MYAIISDVHANLEALQAVRADIDRHPVEAVYCLGDVVGYGADPGACLDLVIRACGVMVRGNHTAAVLDDAEAEHFSPTAVRSVEWTRGQLWGEAADPGMAVRRLEFLEGLPLVHRQGPLLLAHGSPCDPLHQYIFPRDRWDLLRMDLLFRAVEGVCFVGHTHIASVFEETAPGEPCNFWRPEDCDHAYRLNGRKVLVNVGAVGQPRDGDTRASYVLLDGQTVRFRRVSYDVEKAAAKVQAVPPLGEGLANRLRAGR